ncbi:MAG: hypothetical protein R3C56_18250 [Pirellulaceae bacterium]
MPAFLVQPEQDLQVISAWMALQPTAGLVIHTGWNRKDNLRRNTMQTMKSTTWFTLQVTFPSLADAIAGQASRSVDSDIAALDALDHIWHDIGAGKISVSVFPEPYRDEIHMTTQAGRYLMHNVLRQSMQNRP